MMSHKCGDQQKVRCGKFGDQRVMSCTRGNQCNGRCNGEKCCGLLNVCWNRLRNWGNTDDDDRIDGAGNGAYLRKVQIYPGHNYRHDHHQYHAASEKLWIGG